MAAESIDAVLLSRLKSSGSCWYPDKNQEYRGSNIINFQGFVTTRKIAEKENELAEQIMALLQTPVSEIIPAKRIDELIDEFEATKNEGRKLHQHQRDAVHMVVNNNISILTGGPGTGKTTVLNCIAYVLRSIYKGVRICFTAPTGKAARRINESTGEPAMTLHKKLGLGYNVKKGKRFTADVLFVDEASMLDLDLAYELYNSVDEFNKVVLVGDEKQLPSVGYGSILRDLIRSNVIPFTRLTKTFRQDNSSTLFENIKNIANGIVKLIKGSDFDYEILEDDAKMSDIAKLLRNIYLEKVEKYGIENVILLLPYRKVNKRVVSSETMNGFIHSVIKNGVPGISHTVDGQTRFFCLGDLVMQLQNREECSNGEVGKIIEIDGSSLTVNYGKREFGEGNIEDAIVTYNFEELDQITLAYAMSVNKSQGSEYPCVIMCLLNEHKGMLNRNILYTGITRAKKECYVVCQNSALKEAIETEADVDRYSFLAEKLQYLSNAYKAERAVANL